MGMAATEYKQANSRIGPIVTELRQRLEKLHRDRLHSMLLYGSRARGDDEMDSDIDVLVVLNGPVNPAEEIARTSHMVADLSLKNDVVLSCLFISADRYAAEQSPLILNVRREGVAV